MFRTLSMPLTSKPSAIPGMLAAAGMLLLLLAIAMPMLYKSNLRYDVALL